MDRIIKTDRTLHVPVGDGASMSLPLPDWLWQMNWVRPEPPRGTQCDDRMLSVSIMESYLYLIENCTKEEGWRRIKILRQAMRDVRAAGQTVRDSERTMRRSARPAPERC